MKRVLPTLLLTIAMCFGKAQTTTSVWFNELVPDPGPQEDEYIEFYNNSTTDVSLDCYVIVSYFKSGQNNNAQEGVYVYNFPANATIKALSYYLISSNNPVRYKASSGGTYTPTDPTSFSNWNSIGTGGYISKYTYSNNNWSSEQSVGNNFGDFMDVRNGFDATLFLYKINSDGSTSYVNGFVANPQASDIEALLARIRGFNSLPISPSSTCGGNASLVDLNFSVITSSNTDVVSLQQATGSGQGYAKLGDGYCGSWEKIQQGEFSPGSKNTFGTASGTITTVENYYCDNIVEFSIQAGTSSYFPIEVKLYYDYGTIGEFDAADEYKSSIFVTSPNGEFHTFSIADDGQPVLLVYLSSMGCYNKIVAPPAATPTVDLTGNISCTITNNTRAVTYSIASISSPTVLPLTLEVIDDNGTPANSSDDVILNTHTISSTPFTDYTAEMKSIFSNITLSVQSSTLSCFTGSEIVTNNCTILPVSFKSFTAIRNKQNSELVLLKWETASEQNNRGFHIQRNTSGEWKNIAFIASQSSDGNSSTLLTYEYKDVNASNSTTQYRIQQVDIDGKTSFSDVRTVMSASKEGGVLIYPNPGTNGKVNVMFREHNAVRFVIVTDINGRLVKQFPQVRDNRLTIEGLQSGFYTIKIIDRATSAISVEKVIID